MNIQLLAPSVEFEKSYLAAQAEMTRASDISSWVYLGDAADPLTPQKDFAGYVKTLKHRQTHAAPGFVCDSTFWAIHEREVVGRISIRHELNDFLRKIGGHIGYITRPSARGKGVASQMLAAILQTERARAMKEVLLTCDADNEASIRTIVKNGGRLTDRFPQGEGRPDKNHFWITTG